MFGCLNQSETIEGILMKFGIQTGYELTLMIVYFSSHGNAGKATGRSYLIFPNGDYGRPSNVEDAYFQQGTVNYCW